VNFIGAQPHELIYDLLCGADIFVLPSYREAFGIAYLEAMAAGLVTIGVQGQGPEAFIEHGKTGYLVEPRNPRSLANCILNIAADRDTARRVSTTGSDLVRNEFTWDAHARHLHNVYREIVK
jgi:glycosyltransferase involved in cell wall biosynthesis